MNKILKALSVVAASAMVLAQAAVAPALAVPPARKLPMQAVHVIRTSIAYTDITASTLKSKVIGTIPSGSYIVGAFASVTTAFTAGSSVSLAIGTLTSTESVMSSSTFTPTASRKLGVLSPAVAADTTFYINTVAASHSTLAAGAADVVILYYPFSN